jgi:pseudomonalisin
MTNGLPQLFGTGLGLSAAAGLNSYAVLLVYGAMARFFPEDYPGAIARLLASTPALSVAAILFFIEFFADKIPGLDHFWHLLHSFVRPVVGALVALAVVQPEGSAVLNVVAAGSGGTVALVSHLVKSATRLTSTALTAGIANAGISLAEDIVAFLQSLVSIFLPLVALLVVAAIGLLFVLAVPRMARSIDLFGRRRSGGPPAGAAVLVLLLLAAHGALGARPDDALTNVGGVPPEVAGARDIARLDGDARLDRILLVLPHRNPEVLARLLANQQDPASPDFRRWLFPAEFERRFGASDADVSALRAWLTSHGLEVEDAPAGRAALVFSGRARDVESAFDTELHELFFEGRVRIANVRPARLPLDLARRVAGVLSLHSFPRRRPLAHRAPANTSEGSHYLAPADFTAIYNVDALVASGLNGSGRTIGLLAQTNVNVADTTYFREYFGLPANDPVVVLNGSDPLIQSDDELESDIDIQWAGAVAPAARTLLIASATTETAYGVDLSALYAVSTNLADVLSLSYGACELDFGDVDTSFYTNVWAQAAAQGISVFVASGDSGVTGCDPKGVNAPDASVNGLCSSPYATCVGGTQFNDGGVGSSTYWNTTNDAKTKKSVKSYVPETAWSGSGGGKSILFARPPWQNVAGLPADGARYVPDVSLAASTHTPYLAVQGHTATSNGLINNYGGTSFSSPALAGLAALLSQKAGTRLGNLNPLLYAVGRSQYGTADASASSPLAAGSPVFHDITTGNNAASGVAGYAAGPGYDAATGLGSVDAFALASALPAPAPSSTDFTLGANPATPALPVGGSVVVNLALYQIGAADGDAVATVTLAGLPSGVTSEFRPGNPANPMTGVLSRAQPATLTLSASYGVAAGPYPLQLQATSGSVVRGLTLFLTVGSGAATPPTGVVVQAPVVLDVFGVAPSHYTSDFVAVNRSGSDATLVLVYVPAAGTPGAGGPAVARTLPAGRQLYVPDVIAFLAANGWSLPSDGSGKLGTFFATFVGVSDPAAVFAGSRTSTPNLSASVGGAFGLFEPAVPSGGANGSGDTWIYGLRENTLFRSNLAVVHAPGTASGATSGPVSLEIQLYDGDSGALAGTPLTHTLQPGEFFQFNFILRYTPVLVQLGITNGYARIRRTSGTDRFIAYGVVNDGGSAGGGTSDGSFLVANATEGLVPILLDLPGPPHFTTDLTLTNPTSAPVTVTLTYTASSASGFSGQGSGTRTRTLAAHQQLVQANALSYLRGLGLAIPTTGNQGGTLLVAGVVAQARTSNPNPDTSVGGSYGLSYPAVAASARAKGEAWVYGLRQDADVRSNLAIADARAGSSGTVTYVIDVFDADTGSTTPVQTLTRPLTGGEWTQIDGILSGAGIAHGYVRIRPDSGTSDFVVYGVVNDGPTAGSRTSDGSYVPMVVIN